jgi:hypothetical protein
MLKKMFFRPSEYFIPDDTPKLKSSKVFNWFALCLFFIMYILFFVLVDLIQKKPSMFQGTLGAMAEVFYIAWFFAFGFIFVLVVDLGISFILLECFKMDVQKKGGFILKLLPVSLISIGLSFVYTGLDDIFKNVIVFAICFWFVFMLFNYIKRGNSKLIINVIICTIVLVLRLFVYFIFAHTILIYFKIML